jgi:hypothetical protein
MEALQDAIIAQEAGMAALRAQPTYAIFVAERWTVPEGDKNVLARALGVEYVRLEEAVMASVIENAKLAAEITGQELQLAAANAAVAVVPVLARRDESERETQYRLLGHLPSFKPEHGWVDKKTGRENKSYKSQARRLEKVALPFAKALDVLPGPDSAMVVGLEPKHMELRVKLEQAFKLITEGMALIAEHSTDLILAQESSWEDVDTFRHRHDTLDPKLAEEWGKHVSKRSKVEEGRVRDDRLASMSNSFRGAGRGRGGDFPQFARQPWGPQVQQGFQPGGRGFPPPPPYLQGGWQGRGRGRGY